MRHIWKAQILGAGMLTPALAGLPHAAAARSVDMDAHGTASSLGVSPSPSEIRVLQEGVFVLTPAEKLKIGGSRIQLAGARSHANTEAPGSRTAHTGRSRHQAAAHRRSWFGVHTCKNTATC